MNMFNLIPSTVELEMGDCGGTCVSCVACVGCTGCQGAATGIDPYPDPK